MQPILSLAVEIISKPHSIFFHQSKEEAEFNKLTEEIQNTDFYSKQGVNILAMKQQLCSVIIKGFLLFIHLLGVYPVFCLFLSGYVSSCFCKYG